MGLNLVWNGGSGIIDCDRLEPFLDWSFIISPIFSKRIFFVPSSPQIRIFQLKCMVSTKDGGDLLDLMSFLVLNLCIHELPNRRAKSPVKKLCFLTGLA